MSKFMKLFKSEEERDVFLKENAKSTAPMILLTAGSKIMYGSVANLNDPFIRLTINVSDVSVDTPIVNSVSTYALLGVSADGKKRLLRDNCIRFRKRGKHVVLIYLKSDSFYNGLSFKRCNSIEKVEFLKSVEIINRGMFEKCVNLSEVVMPDSVKIINDGAFYGCKNLKEISLNEGITHIGAESFYMCGLGNDMVIPSTVESIGDYAFYKCDNITSVQFSDIENLKKIGKKSFNDTIKIPQVED